MNKCQVEFYREIGSGTKWNTFFHILWIAQKLTAAMSGDQQCTFERSFQNIQFLINKVSLEDTGVHDNKYMDFGIQISE